MIPTLERDCSNEAKSNIVSRASTAVQGKDMRLGTRKMHDSDDEEGPTLDICPSWMG